VCCRFELFSIATSAVRGVAGKFAGAATTPTGAICFAPYNANAVGCFTLSTSVTSAGTTIDIAASSFSLIDISEHLTMPRKFYGAATTYWATAHTVAALSAAFIALFSLTVLLGLFCAGTGHRQPSSLRRTMRQPLGCSPPAMW
jgi:hypothetical protein